MPTSMVKNETARLKRKNSKYPPQKSQPELPTLKVQTLSAHVKHENLKCHLKGQNPKCPPQRSHPRLATLKVKNLSAHLKGQNPKCPP